MLEPDGTIWTGRNSGWATAEATLTRKPPQEQNTRGEIVPAGQRAKISKPFFSKMPRALEVVGVKPDAHAAPLAAAWLSL